MIRIAIIFDQRYQKIEKQKMFVPIGSRAMKSILFKKIIIHIRINNNQFIHMKHDQII